MKKIKAIIESLTNDLDVIVQRKPYQSDSAEPEDNSNDVPTAPADTGMSPGSKGINKMGK